MKLFTETKSFEVQLTKQLKQNDRPIPNKFVMTEEFKSGLVVLNKFDLKYTSELNLFNINIDYFKYGVYGAFINSRNMVFVQGDKAVIMKGNYSFVEEYISCYMKEIKYIITHLEQLR